MHKLLHVKGHPKLSCWHPLSMKQYYHSLVPKLVPGEVFPRFFVKRNVTASPNDERKNLSCLFSKRGSVAAAQPLCPFPSWAGRSQPTGRLGAQEAPKTLGLCSFTRTLNQLCDLGQLTFLTSVPPFKNRTNNPYSAGLLERIKYNLLLYSTSIC